MLEPLIALNNDVCAALFEIRQAQTQAQREAAQRHLTSAQKAWVRGCNTYRCDYQGRPKFRAQA